jgi:WhiB family redox-sensing transcriptional regulator
VSTFVPAPPPVTVAYGTSPEIHYDWRHYAACLRSDPELFFPHPGQEDISDALAVCERCPVDAACLAHALKHRINDGVWGGKTEAERQGIIRRASRAKGRHTA